MPRRKKAVRHRAVRRRAPARRRRNPATPPPFMSPLPFHSTYDVYVGGKKVTSFSSSSPGAASEAKRDLARGYGLDPRAVEVRRHNPAKKRVSRRSQGDKTAARELVLYAQNDGDLYRQQGHPIALNLLRKLKKGTYDSALSEKLWFYFATTAAKKYVREFGGPPPGNVSYVFTAETRRMAARQMRRDFEAEYVLSAGRRVKRTR